MLVFAFNGRDGKLAHDWLPQFVELPPWEEVLLPEAPIDWKWSAGSEPFEVDVLFVHPNCEDARQLKVLITAMLNPMVDRELLDRQSVKLYELATRSVAGPSEVIDVAKVRRVEVAAAYRGSTFAWRDYASGANFSEAKPALLIFSVVNRGPARSQSEPSSTISALQDLSMAFAACFVPCGALLLLLHGNPLEIQEMHWLDQVLRWRAELGLAPVADPHIVHLDLDTDELDRLRTSRRNIGMPPISVAEASDLGASVIVLDIVFGRGSRESAQPILEASRTCEVEQLLRRLCRVSGRSAGSKAILPVRRATPPIWLSYECAERRRWRAATLRFRSPGSRRPGALARFGCLFGLAQT